jgi:tRNA pseudouridine55 synthase
MPKIYSSLEGFLLIKKPRDVTSYSIINRLKRIIDRKVRIGHAGILDMFASGLLVVGIGRAATRQLRHYMILDKRYRATGKFGQLTDSLDHQGASILDENPPIIMNEQLEATLRSFGNSYEQIPPIYSSLKHEGYSLSDLIRKGLKTTQELERVVLHKKRAVSLYELKLIDLSHPFFTIEAHVSHGTYIRSLMNDIAQKMGTHATTYELTRTSIGSLSVEDAIAIDSIAVFNDIKKYLITVEEMSKHIECTR